MVKVAELGNKKAHPDGRAEVEQQLVGRLSAAFQHTTHSASAGVAVDEMDVVVVPGGLVHKH